MIINRINAYNDAYINFGRHGKINTNQANNKKQKVKKAVIFTLGALALTGAAIIAYNNPKIKSKLSSLKNINPAGNDITKPAEKISDKAVETTGYVIGGAAAIAGAGAIATKIEDNKDSQAVNPAKLKEEPKTQESKPVFPAIKIDSDNNKKDIKTSVQNPYGTFEPVDDKNFATSLPDKTKTPRVRRSSKYEIAKEEGLSLNDFREKQGTFYNGKAFIGKMPYSGNIIIQQKDKKTILTYNNGELEESLSKVKTEDGLYTDERKIKYYINDDGTRIAEAYRKNSLKKQWFKESICKTNGSQITIFRANPYDKFLGTFLKKQKKGNWIGYYEDKTFDYRNGFYVIPRDIYTDKVLSRWQLRKFRDMY